MQLKLKQTTETYWSKSERHELFEGDRIEVTVGAPAHGGHCVARTAARTARWSSSGTRCPASGSSPRSPSCTRASCAPTRSRSIDAAPDRVAAALPVRPSGRLRRLRPAARRPGRAARLEGRRGPRAARPAGRADRRADRRLDVRVEPLPGGPLGWRSRVRYAVDAAGRRRAAQAPLARGRADRPLPDRPPGAPELPRAGRLWPDAAAVEAVASTGGDVSVGPARRDPAARAAARPCRRPAASCPAATGRAARRPASRPLAGPAVAGAGRRPGVAGAAGRLLAGAPRCGGHPGRRGARAAPTAPRGRSPGTSTAAPACSRRRWPSGPGARVTVVESAPVGVTAARDQPGRPAAGRGGGGPGGRGAGPAPGHRPGGPGGAGPAADRRRRRWSGRSRRPGRARWPTWRVTRPRWPGTCRPSPPRASGWPSCGRTTASR